MRTAMRSMDEVLQELQLPQEAQLSRHEEETGDDAKEYMELIHHQSVDTSHFDKASPRSAIRGGEMVWSDEHIYNGRYQSEHVSTEYREDIYWEYDDSSIVEEGRDEI